MVDACPRIFQEEEVEVVEIQQHQEDEGRWETLDDDVR